MQPLSMAEKNAPPIETRLRIKLSSQSVYQSNHHHTHSIAAPEDSMSLVVAGAHPRDPAPPHTSATESKHAYHHVNASKPNTLQIHIPYIITSTAHITRQSRTRHRHHISPLARIGRGIDRIRLSIHSLHTECISDTIPPSPVGHSATRAPSIIIAAPAMRAPCCTSVPYILHLHYILYGVRACIARSCRHVEMCLVLAGWLGSVLEGRVLVSTLVLVYWNGMSFISIVLLASHSSYIHG